MKNIFVFAFLNLFCVHLLAQVTFQKVYGGAGDRANSLVKTADGGYILAGASTNYASGGTDVHIVKTDVNGDTLWTRSFGSTSPNSDYANCIRQTQDGGYIVAGRTDDLGPGAQDAYVLKLNSSGDTSWTKTYGTVMNDWANTVEQTTDGGYIIGGSYQTGVGYFIVKTNQNGDTLWTRQYGTFANDMAVSVIEDGTSYMIGGGKWNGSGFVYNITKLSATGGELFSRSYSCFSGASCNLSSMIKTNDGNFLLAGYENGFGNGTSIYLVKVNPSGDTIWTRTYSGNGFEYAYDVKNTSDGGYIIAGSTQIAGVDNALLMKISSNGNITWQKAFGGSSYAYAYSVVQANDGGYAFAGNIYDMSASPRGMYFVKTDTQGNNCNQANATLIMGYPPSIELALISNSYSGVTCTGTSTLVRNGSSVTTICFSTGFNDEQTGSTISVYPNPANDVIHLDFGSDVYVETITLCDLYGRMIRTYPVNNMHSVVIARGDLAAGTYLLMISSEEGSKAVEIEFAD